MQFAFQQQFPEKWLWNTSEQRRYLPGHIYAKAELKIHIAFILFMDSIAIEP